MKGADKGRQRDIAAYRQCAVMQADYCAPKGDSKGLGDFGVGVAVATNANDDNFEAGGW